MAKNDDASPTIKPNFIRLVIVIGYDFLALGPWLRSVSYITPQDLFQVPTSLTPPSPSTETSLSTLDTTTALTTSIATSSSQDNQYIPWQAGVPQQRCTNGQVQLPEAKCSTSTEGGTSSQQLLNVPTHISQIDPIKPREEDILSASHSPGAQISSQAQIPLSPMMQAHFIHLASAHPRQVQPTITQASQIPQSLKRIPLQISFNPYFPFFGLTAPSS